MERTHIYVPVEPSPDYSTVGFQRKAIADATEADLLIVKQLKDHQHGLLSGEPITKETMIDQLKTYFKGKEHE